MKQIGNLAGVCASHPGVLLQAYTGWANVRIGHNTNRAVLSEKGEM